MVDILLDLTSDVFGGGLAGRVSADGGPAGAGRAPNQAPDVPASAGRADADTGAQQIRHRALWRGSVVLGGVASLAVGAILGGVFDGVPVRLPATAADAGTGTVSSENGTAVALGVERSALAAYAVVDQRAPKRRQGAWARGVGPATARSSVATPKPVTKPAAGQGPGRTTASDPGSTSAPTTSVPVDLTAGGSGTDRALATAGSTSCPLCTSASPTSDGLSQLGDTISSVGGVVSGAVGTLTKTLGTALQNASSTAANGVSTVSGSSSTPSAAPASSSPDATSGSVNPMSSILQQPSSSSPVVGGVVSTVTSLLGL